MVSQHGIVKAIDSLPPTGARFGVLIIGGVAAFVLAYLLCRTNWSSGLLTKKRHAKKERTGLVVMAILSAIICLLIALAATNRI